MKWVLVAALFNITAFGLEITFNRTFTKEVEPDKMEAHISFKAAATTTEEVIRRLARIDNIVKQRKGSTTLKGGNYRVYKRYRFEHGKQIKEGMEGMVPYTIISDNAAAINSLLASLTKEARDAHVVMQIGNVNRVQSDAAKQHALSSLQISTIDAVKKEVQRFSHTIKMHCQPKSINFLHRSALLPRAAAMMSKAVAHESMPTPSKEGYKITLTANVKAVCQ